MTAYGHPGERSKINELLRILNRPYYYGLGNHDIENNNNDCLNNRCSYGSMLEFNQHVRNHINNGIIRSYDSQRISVHNSNTMGSFSYSMYIDNICLIQLNNFPGMVQSITSTTGGGIVQPPTTSEFRFNGNLDWLERELSHAVTAGKAIIINMHKPNIDDTSWTTASQDTRNRFRNLLRQYGVKAIFAGHHHMSNGYYSDIEGVPVFLSGSASQSTYLIAEYDNLNMNIFLVRNNNWRQKSLVTTIVLQSNTETNPPEEVEPEEGNTAIIYPPTQGNLSIDNWNWSGTLNYTYSRYYFESGAFETSAYTNHKVEYYDLEGRLIGSNNAQYVNGIYTTSYHSAWSPYYAKIINVTLGEPARNAHYSAWQVFLPQNDIPTD